MLVRWLVLPLLLSALLMAGCGDDGDDRDGTDTNMGATKEIAGDWTAQLEQRNLKPFQIAVRIEPNGTGRVAYTGIECGGDWDLGGVQESLPPHYLFAEDIREGAGGACKGSGDVTITPRLRKPHPQAAYTELDYSFTGGGVTSRGVLHRTDAAGLKPIFDEAGVTPP
jgi:hypothetical protein